MQSSLQDIALDVVYEDAHLLVVNKPAGLVVHPSPGHESGTLVNAVLHHCNLPAVHVLPGQLPPASLDAEWGAGVLAITAFTHAVPEMQHRRYGLPGFMWQCTLRYRNS